MSLIRIAPSILAADFTCLGREVRSVLDAGAELIHVDVMDGVFVPNISLGVPVLKSLRRAFPAAVFDVHLMITEPGRYVDAFADAGASMLTLHVEADEPAGITRALEKIKARGLGAGLSLRPGTPAGALSPWLRDLDLVLVMTVEPGFGGQSFREDQLNKLRELRARLTAENPGCALSVDGGIDPRTAPLAAAAGADMLVAGSAVFGAADRAAAIASLRIE